MENNLLFQLMVGVLIGASAGYLGSFMVLKRMSLVGDALSHVALPGMAIALLLNLPPIFGAFTALSFAVFLIWLLEKTSRIYPEAIVGLIFTASLAIGVLITPEHELLEALFGDIQKISFWEGILAMIVSLALLFLVWSISKKLILGIISEDLAKTSGISISKINLIYLLLVGVIVALGVKFVGTLLMGALVIIPAAAAKNLGKGINSYSLLSALIGVISATAGIICSSIFQLPTGPIVVLTAVFIFLPSILFRNEHN